MANTVFCKKFQKEMEALDRAPLPGAKGQEILQNISKQAWQEWQLLQTMMINWCYFTQQQAALFYCLIYW